MPRELREHRHAQVCLALAMENVLQRVNNDETRFQELVPPFFSRETYLVDTEDVERNPGTFTEEVVPWAEINVSIRLLIQGLLGEEYSARQGLPAVAENTARSAPPPARYPSRSGENQPSVSHQPSEPTPPPLPPLPPTPYPGPPSSGPVAAPLAPAMAVELAVAPRPAENEYADLTEGLGQLGAQLERLEMLEMLQGLLRANILLGSWDEACLGLPSRSAGQRPGDEGVPSPW
eukprot:8004661-Pyramimonas_sp.AAC.1